MTTFYLIAQTEDAAKKFAAFLRPGQWDVGVSNQKAAVLDRHGAQPSFMALDYHPYAVTVESSPTGFSVANIERLK